MSKEVTPHIIWKALLLVAALGILCLALFGCNPVKKVLKDTAKMEHVFNEGVKLGWCVNDTLVISKSDTLITFDTLFAIDFQTDTMTVDREIVRTKLVTKTVKIRDTITKVVTDNSRINLLQKELIKKDGELIAKNDELTESKAETKEARKDRNKWRLWFFLLAGAFAAFLFRKPLKFLINRVSPIKI